MKKVTKKNLLHIRKKYKTLDDRIVSFEKISHVAKYIKYNDKRIFFIGIKIGEGVDGEVYDLYDKIEATGGVTEMPVEGSHVYAIKISPIKIDGDNEELKILKILRTFQEKYKVHVYPYLITNFKCNNMTGEYYSNDNIKANYYKKDFIDTLSDYVKIEKDKKFDIDKFSQYLGIQKYTNVANMYIMDLIGYSFKEHLDKFTDSTKNIFRKELIARIISGIVPSLVQFDVYHLDLHLNNILLTDVEDKYRLIYINGKKYTYQTNGYDIKIIDFSRSTIWGSPHMKIKILKQYKRLFPEFYKENKKKIIESLTKERSRFLLHSIDIYRFMISYQYYIKMRFNRDFKLIDNIINESRLDVTTRLLNTEDLSKSLLGKMIKEIENKKEKMKLK